MEISQKQARKLKVSPKIVLSPGLEKCCLRASAKTSYQQAEEDIEELMGIKVGHSSLHRLVERTERVRPLVDKSCCNQGSTGNPY
ncbi:MAG: hypothetical protein KA717_05720 [Woronichinia naegeliana WA131]|uniref:Uncharacterized protein n=1 Tax=Woronichinia naegeliana WA131 TaxID=2824559 RepID=A0A977PX12_9CYAN|nr:MAG: hypothetical protein KA717_05720 [Woronichinia naegeliana WA131]